jgi:GDP-4-dehydro-6-deoxy-D-mannose reductase
VKRLLVTGADGFVGRWLVRVARDDGWQVIASVLPGAAVPAEWSASGSGSAVSTVAADLREAAHIKRLSAVGADAVVHLAGIASGAAARENPAAAFRLNGAATALLADTLSNADKPRFLFISTGEVYGAGHDGPINESTPVQPASPYALSKARGEGLLQAIGRSTGMPVVIARAFPHTGPGQGPAYVLPALTQRLLDAKRSEAATVKTGNLAAVRDFLDVRDVVRAYLLLLDRGTPGDVYNVASGLGHRLSDCFAALARLIGVDARAVEDAALLRPGDIPVLIGDASRLRTCTGWSPQFSFERTLQDLVNAQAH